VSCCSCELSCRSCLLNRKAISRRSQAGRGSELLRVQELLDAADDAEDRLHLLVQLIPELLLLADFTQAQKLLFQSQLQALKLQMPNNISDFEN
jgi:hypothetical protein